MFLTKQNQYKASVDYYRDLSQVNIELEKMILILTIIIIQFLQNSNGQKPCQPSLTTVSGSASLNKKICVGDLIFSEDFNKIDLNKWQKENTLYGGYVGI